jgi:hypothetical protein
LDQVQCRFLSGLQGLRKRDNANLVAFGVDQAYFTGFNFFVYWRSFAAPFCVIAFNC